MKCTQYNLVSLIYFIQIINLLYSKLFRMKSDTQAGDIVDNYDCSAERKIREKITADRVRIKLQQCKHTRAKNT